MRRTADVAHLYDLHHRGQRGHGAAAHRMPVILEWETWPVWLGAAAGDPPALLLWPAAEGVVKLLPVSRAVNSVRNNGAALLDCIEDPALSAYERRVK